MKPNEALATIVAAVVSLGFSSLASRYTLVTPADSASNINGEEQHFSQLAAHIESILLRLLAELQVLETQQTARDRLREQVSKGLNWYELTAALDALCDLVLGAQQSRQADFERYLLQLNERLSQFQGNLEEAQSSYSGSLDAERELSGAIRGQVQVLNDSVRAADDLSSLKANVEARLNSLLENIRGPSWPLIFQVSHLKARAKI